MEKIFPGLFIVLLCSGNIRAQSTPTAISVDNAIQELTNNLSNNGTNKTPGSFVSFSSKEDTKGSRYFFNRWVKGAVTGNNGVTINNDSISYNFDKISNSLYITSDMKTMMELEKGQLKSFTLKNSNSDPMVFVKLDNIHSGFFQVISETAGKYSVYKYTHTKFKKADYHSDGLVETGKNYDEYVDEDEYYVVMPDGKEFKKIELTKKSIVKTLNTDKVKSYFSQHAGEDINDAFLKNMVEFMNN